MIHKSFFENFSDLIFATAVSTCSDVRREDIFFSARNVLPSVKHLWCVAMRENNKERFCYCLLSFFFIDSIICPTNRARRIGEQVCKCEDICAGASLFLTHFSELVALFSSISPRWKRNSSPIIDRRRRTDSCENDLDISDCYCRHLFKRGRLKNQTKQNVYICVRYLTSSTCKQLNASMKNNILSKKEEYHQRSREEILLPPSHLSLSPWNKWDSYRWNWYI